MKSEERIKQELRVLEKQGRLNNHFGDIIEDRIQLLKWVLKDE